VRYSVPHELVDTRVWARFHSDELIVTTAGHDGPVEVARHRRGALGNPVISAKESAANMQAISGRRTSSGGGRFAARPGWFRWCLAAARRSLG
jgi:hypothetical protein